MITLPKPNQTIKSNTQNPRKLFIFGPPKTGKTELCTHLPNHLLIDLEDGSEYVSGTKINVVKEAKEAGVGVLDILKQITDSIAEENRKNGGPIYDYGILDTSTALEEQAKELALMMYKSTNIGRSFKGTDIYNLPQGAGYGWTREAFQKIYSSFEGLFAKSLILLGHVKSASIVKDGKDLSARDINLTGKLKTIVAADCDAIGYLYRNKGTNENILSFKTNEQDLATGSRSPHLRGNEFLISELQDDDTLITHWDKIFLDENS